MGQKIPCSLCFFLPSPFREWSPLDPLRQQAGVEHGLKENQQQRNEPKHPKQVVTYLPSSPRAMPPSRSQKVDGDSYSQPEPRRYSCLPPGGEGAVLPGRGEVVGAVFLGGAWRRPGTSAAAGGGEDKTMLPHGVQRLWGDFAHASWGPPVCELGIFWQNE